MKYEIVNVERKSLVGLEERIKNDGAAVEKIKRLWEKVLTEDGIGSIKNRVNENCIGLYYNYSFKDGLEYDHFVGAEIEKNVENTSIMKKIEIPEGKYAKFKIFGNPKTAVTKFWEEFWKNFDNEIRTFTYDFEEYVAGNNYENTEIHIYISIK